MNLGQDIDVAIQKALADAKSSGSSRYVYLENYELFMRRTYVAGSIKISPVDTFFEARRRFIVAFFNRAQNPTTRYSTALEIGGALALVTLTSIIVYKTLQ